MATTIPAQRVWTYADLDDLPDDEQLYEIVGGELLVRNAPDDNHSLVLTEFVIFLGRAQDASYGLVFASVTAVALDYGDLGEAAKDVPHPDLFFFKEDRAEEYRGRRGWHGVPDLIVEILSKTTRRQHAPGGSHWDMYERNGVPHYWLVDPIARTIRQFTLQGEPYASGHFGEPVTLRAGDALSSPLFPTVSVPVERIFRRVRDAEAED